MDSKLIPYRVHHYDFVYRNIKDAFLLIPFILIPTLIEEGYKALKRFWDISAENVKRNYTNAEILPPNGLSFSGFEIENGINGYIITLPKPLYAPEAYFIGMIYNGPFETEEEYENEINRFFTLEYSINFDPENNMFPNKLAETTCISRFHLAENIIPDYDVFKSVLISIVKEPDRFKRSMKFPGLG